MTERDYQNSHMSFLTCDKKYRKNTLWNTTWTVIALRHSHHSYLSLETTEGMSPLFSIINYKFKLVMYLRTKGWNTKWISHQVNTLCIPGANKGDKFLIKEPKGLRSLFKKPPSSFCIGSKVLFVGLVWYSLVLLFPGHPKAKFFVKMTVIKSKTTVKFLIFIVSEKVFMS